MGGLGSETSAAPLQPQLGRAGWPDSQATEGSGWFMVEPSHELFLAGQPQPDAVWQGWRRGGRLEMRRGGEGALECLEFDFGIKHTEAVGMVAQESATLVLLYHLF